MDGRLDKLESITKENNHLIGSLTTKNRKDFERDLHNLEMTRSRQDSRLSEVEKDVKDIQSDLRTIQVDTRAMQKDLDHIQYRLAHTETSLDRNTKEHVDLFTNDVIGQIIDEVIIRIQREQILGKGKKDE